VDVVAAVVADEQSFELVQPGECALDHPAVAAESGAVLAFAASDLRCDAAATQLAPVAVGVIAAVGGQPVGPSTGATDDAAHRWHRVEERDQLGDVVAVTARERPGERDPGRIDQEVLLRPVSGSINRARARLGAPFFACT
jgi:hypothetical protein